MSHITQQQIEELTLLLLYLTSWDESKKDDPIPLIRSWKGYDFNVINSLADKGLIFGSKRAKSVYFTEKGIKLAEEIKKKIFPS